MKNKLKKYKKNVIMQIFYLSEDPRVCAQMHSNKHLIKGILETAQLLCSSHHMCESSYTPPYKLTHKNHPCAKWCRYSIGNYKWLVELGKELCKEYTYRYGKIHKSQKYIYEMGKNMPNISNTKFTMPVQAMPDMYKDSDSVYAYREYYFYEKCLLHQYKKREMPDWLIKMWEDLEIEYKQ